MTRRPGKNIQPRNDHLEIEKPDRIYFCPNCGSSMTTEAKFCPICGQKRIHPHDHSVGHLIIESVGDFFHLDSKFFATLRPLVFRPGYLTDEYLQGRRARYFQPFKLFLFISFLYFLTSGLIDHYKSGNDRQVIGFQNEDGTTGNKNDPDTLKFSLNKAYDAILAIPDDSVRKMVKHYGLNRYVDLNFPRASWFPRFLIKQVIKNRLQGSGTFTENMKKTIPKLVFILIPFIALLLKLLYIRKKIRYFDHIIFSLHSLSFFFLMLWIKQFGSLMSKWFGPATFILITVYIFFAMLRIYRQKVSTTIGKFFTLFFGSLFMMALFYIIAASISFLMI
jgi:hypothetical protein